jgi:hypothetical protein
MKNLIKVVLVGGATFFAIDYITKRKQNKKKESILEPVVEEAVVIEETEAPQPLTQPTKQAPIPVDSSFSGANGWDSSTTISDGIDG